MYKQAKVLRVIDGDTITVVLAECKTQKVFRLIGIDTLETQKNKKLTLQAVRYKKPQKEILKLGRKAKKFVSDILFDEPNIDYIHFGIDQYGRDLVWIKGLNYPLVFRGHASFFDEKKLNKLFSYKLIDAEIEAKENKRGIWS
jgi:endonuclease YncB( thermonuclease family)